MAALVLRDNSEACMHVVTAMLTFRTISAGQLHHGAAFKLSLLKLLHFTPELGANPAVVLNKHQRSPAIESRIPCQVLALKLVPHKCAPLRYYSITQAPVQDQV